MTPPLFSLVLLRLASQIVYPQDRADWVAEWKGELWAVSAARRPAVLSFVFGSFHDAWHLRCRSVRVQSTRMQSPEACLVLLACFIGLAAVIFPRVFNNAPRANPHPNLMFAATIALSLVLLNCVWSWELTIPEGASSVRPLCTRWYLFLVAKFGAVLIMAYQATVHLVMHGLPPQVVIVGCTAAFLWIQREQRQRCPVCLHRLVRPVRIGTYAQTFLGWNGTESICKKGHGALYVGCVTTGRTARTAWTGMDSTWADLFSEGQSARP